MMAISKHKPVGILGVTGIATNELDDDAVQALSVLGRRAALALRDRQIQQQVFQTLVELDPAGGDDPIFARRRTL